MLILCFSRRPLEELKSDLRGIEISLFAIASSKVFKLKSDLRGIEMGPLPEGKTCLYGVKIRP